MKTVDSAFLRAYGRDRSSSEQANSPHHSSNAAQSRETRGTSVEEMYSDGTYYRVDSPTEVALETEPATRHVAETSWYDPPWGDRGVQVQGEASAPGQADEVPRSISAWDASSFVILPGVDDMPVATSHAKTTSRPANTVKSAKVIEESAKEEIVRRGSDRPVESRRPIERSTMRSSKAAAEPSISVATSQAPSTNEPTSAREQHPHTARRTIDRPRQKTSNLDETNSRSKDSIRRKHSGPSVQPGQRRAVNSQDGRLHVRIDKPASTVIPESDVEVEHDRVSTIDTLSTDQGYENDFAQELASTPSMEFSPQTVVISNSMLDELVDEVEARPVENEKAKVSALASVADSKFAPAWEVPNFLWPAICEQLESTNRLRDVGEKLRSAAANGLHVLAVTGSKSGEGCSTVALAIAKSAASSGMRVAVLDADLESPQIAAKLGVDPAANWDDVLVDNLPISESAMASIDDGVTIFPREERLPGDLRLSDQRITHLIDRLAERFDLVVVDLGKLPTEKDQFFGRRKSDKASPINGVAIVRDMRNTTTDELKATVARLKSFGIDQLAIVENFGE